MKVLACRDAGTKCSFVARGETEEELMRVGAEHLKKAHNMDISEFPPEEIAKIKTLIHEEEKNVRKGASNGAKLARHSGAHFQSQDKRYGVKL